MNRNIKNIDFKKLFFKYEEIHQSGEYNMFTDSAKVCKLMGIDIMTYAVIICNYDKLYKEYMIKK